MVLGSGLKKIKKEKKPQEKKPKEEPKVEDKPAEIVKTPPPKTINNKDRMVSALNTFWNSRQNSEDGASLARSIEDIIHD